MSKPLVYVASPYTKGDPAINVHFQCQVFNFLLNEEKVTPIVPLWSHFQHTVFPRPYQDWIRYDNEIIPRCDALLRLTARHDKLGYAEDQSSGADREVELAKSLGIPVFYNFVDLYEWADEQAAIAVAAVV